MPDAPLRACVHPGCGVVVRGANRCPKHAKVHAAEAAARVAARRRENDARRESSTARGYGYRWQQARAGFLRSHPLCAVHFKRGQMETATVVDHVVPHKGDRALFWDRQNWQALCKHCHDSHKQALERGADGASASTSEGGGQNSGPFI